MPDLHSRPATAALQRSRPASRSRSPPVTDGAGRSAWEGSCDGALRVESDGGTQSPPPSLPSPPSPASPPRPRTAAAASAATLPAPLILPASRGGSLRRASSAAATRARTTPVWHDLPPSAAREARVCLSVTQRLRAGGRSRSPSPVRGEADVPAQWGWGEGSAEALGATAGAAGEGNVSRRSPSPQFMRCVGAASLPSTLRPPLTALRGAVRHTFSSASKDMLEAAAAPAPSPVRPYTEFQHPAKTALGGLSDEAISAHACRATPRCIVSPAPQRPSLPAPARTSVTQWLR